MAHHHSERTTGANTQIELERKEEYAERSEDRHRERERVICTYTRGRHMHKPPAPANVKPDKQHVHKFAGRAAHTAQVKGDGTRQPTWLCVEGWRRLRKKGETPNETGRPGDSPSE